MGERENSIHPSALIEGDVQLGVSAMVEAFAYLGAHDRFHPAAPVIIGDNAFIGSRCTVYGGVTAGDDFDISDQTTIFTDNVFGDRCRIGPKVVVKNGCRLGNDVRINSQAFIERVELGSNVFVGPQTVFTDDLHPPCPRYADCVPRTVIGDFVSIGANVTILPGITIKHHCQIGAGAVVTKDIPAYSVVAGNPARIVDDFRQLKCHPGFFERPFEWWEDAD